jgi:hypothetical protein
MKRTTTSITWAALVRLGRIIVSSLRNGGTWLPCFRYLDNLVHEVEPDVVIEGDYNSVGFDGAGLVVWEFSDDDTCEH